VYQYQHCLKTSKMEPRSTILSSGSPGSPGTDKQKLRRSPGSPGTDKQKLRRRLGRVHLGRDLENQPAQAVLVANLRHADYVRVLCGSLEHLPIAFAELDQASRADATPLQRSNRDTRLRIRVKALVKDEQLPSNHPIIERKMPQTGTNSTEI